MTETGETLRLAPLASHHLEGLRKIAASPDTRGQAWPEPRPGVGAQEWVRSAIEARLTGQSQTFSVFHSAFGIVGATRLTIFPVRHAAMLSYWIAPQYRRRHFGFEAAAKTVSAAFRDLGAETVEAPVAAVNKASLAIVRGLGMTCEKELLIQPAAGELQGVLLFAIHACDWARRTQR